MLYKGAKTKEEQKLSKKKLKNLSQNSRKQSQNTIQ